jgi:CPA2 family monovalent cation:H+ antiporter-2
MEHHTPLIGTIVAGIGLAFLFGLAAHRLRLSPLVGYLLAGVVIGPFTPGYVADQGLALQLAEIGIILLMFGVGLHFSLSDLLSVRAIAIPGAIGQIAVATLMGMGLAHWWLGWSLGAGLVFGLALSVASTVVLLRALQQRRLLETERGKIAVGWLIVEDIATVLALVLIPAVSTLLGGRADAAATGSLAQWLAAGNVWGVLALTLGKVAVFVVLMLVVGGRVIPWVLHYVAHTGSRELFRLSVFAIALGVALGAAELFGVSFALGAFFAGMILAESALSQQAANETLPLRDAFAVLFFVSVGMLFDPSILVRQPLEVLATIAIIVFGKSIAAFAIVLAFGHPRRTALTISVSLAQIGEFSFILAALGMTLELLPAAGRDLILAGALVSILLNPLLFWLATRISDAAQLPTGETAAPAPPEPEPRPATDLTDHAVLVGYGRVGSIIARELAEAGMPVVVIEEREGVVTDLQARGIQAIRGGAAEPGLLEAANVAAARWFVSAIPDPFECIELIERARAANPSICIVCRAHQDAAIGRLRETGADHVVLAESEVAREMVRRVLAARVKEPAPPQDKTEPARHGGVDERTSVDHL